MAVICIIEVLFLTVCLFDHHAVGTVPVGGRAAVQPWIRWSTLDWQPLPVSSHKRCAAHYVDVLFLCKLFC